VRSGGVISSFVVKTTDKPPQTAEQPEDALDRMRRETDAILATTAKLVAELEILLEEGRQLRLAQAALMEQRRTLLKESKSSSKAS
jgi:hypothetical protein